MHSGQLLIQLNLAAFLDRGQKLDVLVHDIVGALEGLREHNILEDVNRLGRNIGLLVELSQRTVQIGFTAYTSSLGKSPFGLQILRCLIIQKLGKVEAIKALLGVVLLGKVVLHSIAPKLDPQTIKGLRAETPLFDLCHVLQELLHVVGLITAPLAPQKLGLGHAVLATNHENLILALDQNNPARNDRILTAPEYMTL